MSEQNEDREKLIKQILGDDQPIRVDYRSLGSTGLRNAGGIINEASLRGLTGRRAAAIFKEMGDNDPSLGIIEFMTRNIIRSVTWTVKRASDEERDAQAADLVESCLHDMDRPWDDYVDEMLSFIRYGYSVHEIEYKTRAGRADDPWLRSKYQDSFVGWRGFPTRSQDTIERWVFDPSGALLGVVQMDPMSAKVVEIPLYKMLLFRTRSYKNNPEGESAFLRAYRPWHFKKNIEEAEAMGIQRDLAGMPMIEMPPQVMAKNASPGNRALYKTMKEIVTKVRRDELEGVLMPLIYDENGNKMFQFSLVQSGGSRQYDTSKIIERLDTQIFRTALADFLTLGQGQNSSGSYALHVDKSQIFLLSLKAYLSQIKNVMNLHAIPRLLEMNGLGVSDYPQLEHSALEQVDMKTLAETVSSLAMAGMPIFPNKEIERHILELCGLPAPLDTEKPPPSREPMPTSSDNPPSLREAIHPDTPPPAPTPTKLPGQTSARPIFREEALEQLSSRYRGRQK